jgi:hypothetical protein
MGERGAARNGLGEEGESGKLSWLVTVAMLVSLLLLLLSMLMSMSMLLSLSLLPLWVSLWLLSLGAVSSSDLRA